MASYENLLINTLSQSLQKSKYFPFLFSPLVSFHLLPCVEHINFFIRSRSFLAFPMSQLSSARPIKFVPLWKEIEESHYKFDMDDGSRACFNFARYCSPSKTTDLRLKSWTSLSFGPKIGPVGFWELSDSITFNFSKILPREY